jgi:DnaJ homolog subfamily C member 11
MADSQRGPRGQRARGNSRATGNRLPSGGPADDSSSSSSLHPYARHSLRPMDSRFSLNEQFATTRREIEFGFDDSSSFIGTLASVQPDSEDALKAAADSGSEAEAVPRTYYDLLCLSQEAPVAPEDIRRAYWRLLRALDPQRLPPQLRHTAQAYLAEAQAAFETLIEPSRRLEYDELLADEVSNEEIGEDGDDETADEEGLQAAAVARQKSYLRQYRLQTNTDLGIRLDMSRGLSRRASKLGKPLDFSISQAVHFNAPALGRHTEAAIRALQNALRDPYTKQPSRRIRCAVPILSVSASAYALMEELYLAPTALLYSRYQPLLPETLPRSRLLQLAKGLPTGLITTRYRQELFWKSEPSAFPDAVVEVETDVLPTRSVTTRLATSIPVADSDEPLHTEVMVSTHSSPIPWMTAASSPRLGLALHRRVAPVGTAFLTADSGDWALSARDEVATCRYFEDFARVGQKFLSASVPLRAAPTVEVGFAFTPSELGLRASSALTKPADRGLRGLDVDMSTADRGSNWTVSAAATAETAAAYLRYARAIPAAGGLRLEAELCAARPAPFATYVAVRALARVSAASKLGFEVGLGAAGVQLSLYLSRRGVARFKLPLLLSRATSPRLALWSTVLPLLGLAGLSLWRRNARKKRVAQMDEDTHRREADTLTALLAATVVPRQTAAAAKTGSGEGPVVLSAKYGVRAPGGSGWLDGEEVADVTVAVAALLDEATGSGGEVLVIPAGVRKSRILGFWDPSPGRPKVLEVRYAYRGREGVVVAKGREGVRIGR